MVALNVSHMSKSSRWHPWRQLRDHHPNVHVQCRHELHSTRMGIRHGERIWLCSTLTQAERRCTLTHEIVHVERGPVPAIPHMQMREEAIVDRITARRLIELDALIDALAWNRWQVDADTAGELWVDLPTLRTRVQNLTDDERKYIDAEIERRQP